MQYVFARMDTAMKIYDEIVSQDEYKLKKLFYALRAALVCEWIMEKEEKPPIEFGKAIQGLSLPEMIKSDISRLNELKSIKSETYFHQNEKRLMNYIESIVKVTKIKSKTLPSTKIDIMALDQFFVETLNAQWT